MFRDLLSGKVFVVSGASRGIGRQLCLDLAADGALVVGAARNQEALASLATTVTSAGGRFLPVIADLAGIDGCRTLVERALSEFGRIDALVNNLGVSGAHKSVRDLTPSEWQEAINTNLTSAYACVHFAAGSMMERRSGAIVSISSVGTRVASPKRAAYVASKSGMVGLTRVLAHELGPYNITANVVSPGFIEGERSAEVQHSMARSLGIPLEKVNEMLLARTPLGRTIPAADVSAMIRYLCSDLGRNITGKDIAVDGGMTF